MSEGDVVPEGKRLIDSWEAAGKRLQGAKSDLNRCEVAARNAEQALAKWLLPDDAAPGEKFAVWHGNELIEVTTASLGRDHEVSKRSRRAGQSVPAA
jgi:hypothetical protein